MDSEAKALIRVGGWSDLIESSTDAHSFALVLSCIGIYMEDCSINGITVNKRRQFSNLPKTILSRNTIRVSKCLNPENVGPDLDPNFLQKLSADASKERVSLTAHFYDPQKQSHSRF